MADRRLIYFTSDVHLGLDIPGADAAEREERFVGFLKGIPAERTRALYLMGDIWDFWYEYRDVVPRMGARVIAALISLMDAGVEVWFCTGNHDVWEFSYFESLGMRRFGQPHVFETSGRTFCIGHGDALGGAKWNYRLMMKVFRSKVAQALFSTLHPWLAFRLGLGWSGSNRRTHSSAYRFVPGNEPLYRFASDFASGMPVDFFIFGHYHCPVDVPVGESSRFVLLDSWIAGGTPHALFDGETLTVV